ncbi:LOW QUALITY PROTEIN: ankyrin repeat and zinc finger domain-containing protein 1-like [Pomacea canaliculata]|uniref:LOW QUALITY PROTEIN: ankyrin repeat and zinc finger domain-containing protein 1-like n=1 Tax=Pomacea canaliculata TaxID=400727 RepID=UPI000D73F75C|nr:LOW QUALITY PROTEIN: ankyrin repeat and zinc finger domain-containing protein 1-like [Pomacea canaliculata]
MAQVLSKKLVYKQSSNYSSCLLSEVNTAQQMLAGLMIASCNPTADDILLEEKDRPESLDTESPESEDPSRRQHVISTRMSCSYCSSIFSSRNEQKSHFKCDWHRYNLKQHLRGRKPISEEAFEEMTSDVSSISGSEDSSESSKESGDEAVTSSAVPVNLKKFTCDNSDSERESKTQENSSLATTRKMPKLFMKNSKGQLISIYHCVLYHKKNPPSTVAGLLKMALDAVTYSRVAVIMLAGGHFAAAVFDGSQAVMHKTFHRYVVRAKRGTVQSVRDNQGSAPKSAGASLRRYNEAALAQEIQELLNSWSTFLGACHLIFLKASTYSRHIFFGGKSPALSKSDLRIRTIPFATGRPTHNELKRVHHMLMSVECYGAEDEIKGFLPKSPSRFINPDNGLLEARPMLTQKPSFSRKKKLEVATEKPISSSDKELKQTEDTGNEDEEESATEVELVEKVMEMNTQHLIEFDIWDGKQNKKNKKKKKKKEVPKSSQAPCDNLRSSKAETDNESPELQNKLYTACKSGNHEQLVQLLQQLYLLDRSPNINSQSDLGKQKELEERRISTGQILGSVSVSSGDQVQENVPPSEVSDFNHSKGGDGHLVDSQNGDSSVKNMLCGEKTPNIRREDKVAALDELCLSSQSDQQQTNDGNGKHARCTRSLTRTLHLLNGRIGGRNSTLLHIASAAGHAEVVQTLLETGCDPVIKDSAGKTAYSLAESKEVRNVFRRFRGNHPDRYNYEAAQIPIALTTDMEMERKRKETEKKKMQKKAKQERLKERKAEEAKAATEQKEKERYLALSDREKRALAAERRLLQQSATSGAASPVLSRCFQCGTDITGKVPFEYCDFKFCTPKCLKDHRVNHSK